jgi:hypothetical protein
MQDGQDIPPRSPQVMAGEALAGEVLVKAGQALA